MLLECMKSHVTAEDILELHFTQWIAYLHTPQRKHLDEVRGLMQKRRNSSANALELHLFWIKPSLYYCHSVWWNYFTRNFSTQS